MAHFAELDENNIVKQVIVVDNNELLDENGNESEAKGVAFCQSLFGGNWVQTSYNGNVRKNYAGIGYLYDEESKAFIQPQPFESWVLNRDIYLWEAPVPRPVDENSYEWDEASLSWVQVPSFPKYDDSFVV
jgi:hypothetical protein